MIKPHWTPRYLADRLREWLYQKTHPGAPWLGPGAIRHLQRVLRPHQIGFEAGSGRSTVWIARRVRQLISAEENDAWLERVADDLRHAALHNVELHRVAPSSDGWQTGYEAIVCQVPDNSLDFVVVDAEHERDYLVLALLPKLKAGGFLLLDNANWYLPSRSRSPHSRSLQAGPLNERWAAFAAAVRDWPCVWTSSGVTDTAFYTKPPVG